MKKTILALFTILCFGINANAQSQRDSAAFEYNSEYATGINNVAKQDNIVIYPNPARSEVNIVFDRSADIKSIAIYNLIGKAVTVYKVNGNSAKLDVESIPSGIYFLRMLDGLGHVITTRKFVHQ